MILIDSKLDYSHFYSINIQAINYEKSQRKQKYLLLLKD